MFICVGLIALTYQFSEGTLPIRARRGGAGLARRKQRLTAGIVAFQVHFGSAKNSATAGVLHTSAREPEQATNHQPHFAQADQANQSFFR